MRAQVSGRPLVAIGFLAIWMVGCGSSGGRTGGDTILDQSPIEQVGRMLRTYQKGLKPPTKGDRSLPVYKAAPVPPPRGIKDLMPMAKGFPQAVNAIRGGQVLLFWKTDLTDDPQAGSTVLAFTREVPVSGGQVLLRDGTIQTMTPDEFQAASKPAGAKTDDSQATGTARK